MKNINPDIKLAYEYCLNIAKNHYENFPVASILLPKKIRLPIAAIYAFARQADDYSDEGNLTNTERLAKLNDCEAKLNQIYTKRFSDRDDKIYTALADCIERFNLPMNLFLALIKAFKQDVVKTDYNNFAEILDYCKNSAHPVGRLLLHLTKQDSEKNLELSDNICTSLQLINFLQDIHSDAVERNRCYMPIDEMKLCSLDIDSIKNKIETQEIKGFITKQIQRAEQIMKSGKLLGCKLTGIFGFEIRLIVAGGETIINELYNRNSIYARPTIKNISWLNILFNAVFKR